MSGRGWEAGAAWPVHHKPNHVADLDTIPELHSDVPTAQMLPLEKIASQFGIPALWGCFAEEEERHDAVYE